MKRLYGTLFLLLSFLISFSQTTKKVDIKKSKIEWLGQKVGGEHFGVIQLKSGQITFSSENMIVDGEFIVDMSTIECTDLKGRAKQSIESHLKDEDFFDVKKHQTSKLKITSSDENKIYGTITIKGYSEPIEFDYKLQSRGGQYIIFSEIKIDRTKFDISYKSKSIFPDQFLDNFIYDEFIIKTNPIIFN